MSSDKYLDIRNKTVVKANALIQKSRFSLSLQQQKIVLYLISQIQPSDEKFKIYEFDTQEFCRVCGIDCSGGAGYREIKHAIKEISDKSMWVEILDGTETLVRWIEKPYINDREGTIKIRLDEDMKPFLLHLKESFTKYELIWTLKFKSKYSIRLYELVKSLHYHELETYSKEYYTDELKRLIGAEHYKEYRDFKRKALIPAIEELNKYSDKVISFDELKRGRKVKAVRLNISSKGSIEALKIRNDIEQELGLDQIILWDDIIK